MIDMIKEEGGRELNPVAVELFIRQRKDLKPWIPPEYEGLLLPIADLAEVFESYFSLWERALQNQVPVSAKRRAELRAIAKLRANMHRRLAPCDGGLVRLENV
jgi:hypothetical protein